MSPIIVAALISATSTLTGVIVTTRMQTWRIDADNKARLDAQTGEIKAHVTRTEHP